MWIYRQKTADCGRWRRNVGPLVVPFNHVRVASCVPRRCGFCAQAEGFSGADLAALLREAGLDVLRQLKSREALDGKGVYTEEGETCLCYSMLYSLKYYRASHGNLNRTPCCNPIPCSNGVTAMEWYMRQYCTNRNNGTSLLKWKVVVGHRRFSGPVLLRAVSSIFLPSKVVFSVTENIGPFTDYSRCVRVTTLQAPTTVCEQCVPDSTSCHASYPPVYPDRFPLSSTETGAGAVVMAQNFDNAFLRTQPSVSAPDRAFYLSMKDRLCKARAHSSEASEAAGLQAPPRRKPGGDGSGPQANGK